MALRAVSTQRAPNPAGPYSQAVWAGPLLFMAGQVGLDPSTGAFAPGGFEGQFRQIMKNIAALASTAGSNLSRVVNMTVYLTDERDFSLLNALYSELVPGPVFPARTTVIVKALPLDAVVEATAILLSSK